MPSQMNLPDERVPDEHAQNKKGNLPDEPDHGRSGDEPARRTNQMNRTTTGQEMNLPDEPTR